MKRVLKDAPPSSSSLQIFLLTRPGGLTLAGQCERIPPCQRRGVSGCGCVTRMGPGECPGWHLSKTSTRRGPSPLWRPGGPMSSSDGEAVGFAWSSERTKRASEPAARGVKAGARCWGSTGTRLPPTSTASLGDEESPQGPAPEYGHRGSTYGIKRPSGAVGVGGFAVRAPGGSGCGNTAGRKEGILVPHRCTVLLTASLRVNPKKKKEKKDVVRPQGESGGNT